MKKVTVQLEKARELEPLIHSLYPYYGMGFTYTVTPPVELPSGRIEHSGVLKKFASSEMIVRVVCEKVNGLTVRLKVFVSQPGKQQNEQYYNKVRTHLTNKLCKPLEKDPAKFEAIIRSIIV